MSNEIQLPDYLPSRYKNWYHLYLEVEKIFTENGYELTEETKVRLSELPDFDEKEMSEEAILFYQEFPLPVLKARALDFIMSKIPSFDDVIKMRHYLMLPGGDVGVHEIVDRLLDVCPRNRR